MKPKDHQSQYDFSKKTAIISGGAGVIGSEIAVTLAWFGANVVILSRRTELPAFIREQVEGAPGQVILMPTDVLDSISLKTSAQKIQQQWRSADFLINAIGGNHPSATTSQELKFFDLPTEAIRQVFDLNITGAILPCQVFGKMMAENQNGVILNISSMNAYRPLTRIPAYSAAKAGLSNFTQWLAVHMAQEYSPNIRVNAIAPGFLLGEQNRFLLIDQETKELTRRGKAILDHTPMRRFGRPDDLIGAVLWLLSPAAAFVTGIVLPVDGGFNAYCGV